MSAAKEAREAKRAVSQATYALLAQRRLLAQEAIVVAKRISRASLANGQMDNVLKLHGVWFKLGEVEGLLQVLTGTPPEEAGVWPSRVPDRESKRAPRRKRSSAAPPA